MILPIVIILVRITINHGYIIIITIITLIVDKELRQGRKGVFCEIEIVANYP